MESGQISPAYDLLRLDQTEVCKGQIRPRPGVVRPSGYDVYSTQLIHDYCNSLIAVWQCVEYRWKDLPLLSHYTEEHK